LSRHQPPHPALRATSSRLREKATDCQRCNSVAPTPPFRRLRGKVPEGRMGGSRLAMFPQV
ncbi:hypothetical protein, partial [Xanthomonas phaseoli]|uniref:hypothetical protein n=1 Tax=Xanthomonas phaseoli TaxID=1985254 RepID=UPI001AD9B727